MRESEKEKERNGHKTIANYLGYHTEGARQRLVLRVRSQLAAVRVVGGSGLGMVIRQRYDEIVL